MTSVLFLCVHNSGRSQIAEAFLAKHGEGRFIAESAGLEPGKLNPYVVRAMAEAGIDISGKEAKSVMDLYLADRTYDVVVTVCSKEASERCPAFPGVSRKIHWSFDDPASFSGSVGEIMDRTRKLRDRIEAEIVAFVRDN
jgi:arsenate reductase